MGGKCRSGERVSTPRLALGCQALCSALDVSVLLLSLVVTRVFLDFYCLLSELSGEKIASEALNGDFEPFMLLFWRDLMHFLVTRL